MGPEAGGNQLTWPKRAGQPHLRRFLSSVTSANTSRAWSSIDVTRVSDSKCPLIAAFILPSSPPSSP
eukprot:5927826-Prorocentrum_lima.AAC.1